MKLFEKFQTFNIDLVSGRFNFCSESEYDENACVSNFNILLFYNSLLRAPVGVLGNTAHLWFFVLICLSITIHIKLYDLILV